jgi:putative phosphoserine phosphatase / 1-acylglycerol-3-phosphate O-acyltransferase
VKSLTQHLLNVTRTDQRASTQAPPVAFFDLDHTLIAAYSVVALAMESARYGASRGELGQAAKTLQDVLRQKVDGSGTSYHRLVRRVSKALTGVSEQSLENLGEAAYHNSIARKLYSEAVSLVEAHRRAGHHLVIVSAASRYQVEPVARILGIDEICCTRLEVVEGRFTGRVSSPLCYGEGKSLAARAVAKRCGTNLNRCWFYSDSSADLPLLNKVGHPVAVNPSDKLRAFAREKAWPILEFKTRGKPRLENIARTALTVQALATTSAAGIIAKRLRVNSRNIHNGITQALAAIGSNVAGLQLEIDGAEHLKEAGPAIYIFNHQSLLDSVVMAHLLRKDIVAFCKKELAANPLMGPLLRQGDTIFVDRDDSNQREVLQQALQVLDGGRSLVIAPEGTRSTLGNIQPFKKGAFFLAKKARVPIVPIVLHNMKDALPKGGLLIRPATIRVTVLPPVAPADMGTVRQLCHQLETQYCELLGNSEPAALPYRANVSTMHSAA